MLLKQQIKVFFFSTEIFVSSSGQQVKKGEKEETRQAEEKRDPCGGGQDGWMTGLHAKKRKEGGREGGREENWMRTRNELDAVGRGVSNEASLIFFIA